MRAKLNEVGLAYELEGPDDTPVVLFGHSLSTDRRMFDAQVPLFAEAGYRVLRYDMRGHGESAPPDGPLSMAGLAADVVALLDHLGIDRVHYVGVSIGGMIGQMLGLEHGDRLMSLTLASTTAHIPEDMAPTWDERIATAECDGMQALVEPTVARWFTADALAQSLPEIEPVRAMIANTSVAGFTACCAAIKDFRVRDRLSAVTTPTLVLQGAEDPGTTVEAGRAIAEAIPDARFEVLDNASHMANIERAIRWTAIVRNWIDIMDVAVRKSG